MPMRRNLGPISAPKAHHEWCPFGAWVASHRGKRASLKDRRPLQIAEVHNFGRRGAVFFFLAINRRRERSRTDQRGTNTHSNLFHPTLLRQKDRGPELAKRYSSHPPPATEVNLAVAHRALSSPRRP